MKREFTETELITTVTEFYKGGLYLSKALKIFELEFGYVPKIVEPTMILNQEFIDTQDYPECVTVEALTFMKELQESGVTNMFMASPYIQNALMCDKRDASAILKVYMKDYDKIYYPENNL